MSDIRIEIREDKNHPEGGHAVIRLRGLKDKPQSDTFVIEPADPEFGANDLKGWPSGERTPLTTKMDPAGFEIMVGPDVVESPVLLPGTPVVIKVPAAGVSGEVLWPDITPLRRAKVKRIITSTDRRDALARINAQGKQNGPASPATAAQGLADVEQVNTTGVSARSTNAALSGAAIFGLSVTGQNPAVGEQLVETRQRRPGAGDSGSFIAGTAKDASRVEALGAAAIKARPTTNSARSKLSSLAGAGTHAASPIPDTASKVPKFAVRSPATSAGQAAAEAQGTKKTSTAADLAVGNKGSAMPGRSAGMPEAKMPPPPTVTMPTGNQRLEVEGEGIFAPDDAAPAKGVQLSESQRGGGSYGVLALLLGFLSAGLLAFLVMERSGMLPDNLQWAGLGSQDSAPTLAKPVSLYAAFAAGLQSPRGNDATGVATSDAIERAYRSVNGDNGQRDTQEGAFWLRQYLGKQIADKQTLWALTQLGSTYARPADAAPDYVTARYLWEIAAALGDPVAHCFLGGVHETGLGVPVNKAKALSWYQRAQGLGGCRSLDAAIDRIRSDVVGKK